MRKLEEKEKFFSRREQREFTNKELLEIVNNTEEGKRILEREKERLELEIAKVESSADIETLANVVHAESTRTIFMRVDAFKIERCGTHGRSKCDTLARE